ncbi:unnamed protein product, partial [Brassica oleracea var. botrytis]
QICADGFTVTFPIPPIGENLSLCVFGEAMEPLFLSLYEASGGLLSVLPLCFTDQCWCFSAQRCKTSCRFFYSYALKFCCLMSFFYVCSWQTTLWWWNNVDFKAREAMTQPRSRSRSDEFHRIKDLFIGKEKRKNAFSEQSGRSGSVVLNAT